MTSAKYNLLAVDLGAESGRAILGIFDGEQLQLSEVHRFPNTPVLLPEGLHWDALKLWAEIRSGLALAVQQTGGRLAGLGLDTWGVDFGLLDRTGALIGNPTHYRDSRTDGMLEQVFQRVPRAEIFAQTGIQFMQLNTLYQLYAMVASHSPQLSVAATFLTMPDLFNYWLTGQKACEFSNATTTQCYDPRRKTWARPILQRLGIPDQIFPEIVPSGTLLGDLRKPVAEEAGIVRLPVIAPACHDTGSAVAAIPAAETGEDFAWISSGTWSIMGVTVPEPVITEQSLACSVTNEGGINHTFRLSKNIIGLWPVQESRRTWARQGHDYTYDELTSLAAAAEPLRSVVDPDHADFLKPGDMPARVRVYCERTGQPVPETDGQVVRCLLESVALKYRWTLERLERLHGKRLDSIHIAGGGTKNRLLSQFAANATLRPVITGPVEATAIGNLLVQAMALGVIGSLEDAHQVVRRSFAMQTFTPDASASQAWDDAYARLLNLMGEAC
ncbi:MAG TPA: rhamnulokinase family protein [Anaerolineaceae bacterium]